MKTTRKLGLFALMVSTLALSACDDSLAPGSGVVVAAVTILPSARALHVGDTLTLVAQPVTPDGTPISGLTVHWTSTGSAVAAVTPAGLVTALAPGEATIRATVDGKVGLADLTVTVVPVAHLDVSPEAISLEEGQSQVLAATPRAASGEALQGRQVVWSSQDTEVATVDVTGRVAALRVGTVTLTAESEGKTANVQVTVLEVSVASITITPSAIVLDVGGTRQLTAIVRDAAGNPLSGRPVVWNVDYPAVAMISAGGLLYGTGHGYVTISASSGGKTAHVAATVSNGEMDAMPFDLIYHRSTPQAVGEIIILGTNVGPGPVKLNAGNVSRQPAPSPDGNRIAFYVSMQELGTGRQIDEIFVVDRNGMNMKQLTDDSGINSHPAWSPRGDRIAYRRLDPVTYRSSIWVMNTDGSGKVNITADMDSTYAVDSPAWSPDGSQIAFAVIQTPGWTPVTGIWTMTEHGANKQPRTSSAGFDSQPSWSPDGTQIAFSRSYEDGRDITVLTLAGGTTRRIVLPGTQWSPAWSPDGRHIAFWQPVGYSGSTGVYTVRADGTNVRLHTTNPSWGGGYDPVWIRR